MKFGKIPNVVSKIQTVELGFKDVGQLVTQTCNVTGVKDTAKDRYNLPFTQSRQIYSYVVDVDAAVDFSKITYKTDDENKTCIVFVPHAEIYKSTIDRNTFKEYLDQSNVFSRITLEENNDAIKEIENEGKEQAMSYGIIEKADKNAQNLIENLIKSNKKFKDYSIKYEYK